MPSNPSPSSLPALVSAGFAAGGAPLVFDTRVGRPQRETPMEAAQNSLHLELVRAAVPRFPIQTPLRRIEVGVLSSGGTGSAPVPRSEPKIEPL